MVHTVRNLAVTNFSSSAGSVGMLQVPEILSKSNHRLYTQGGVYRGKITIDNNMTGSLEVYTLVETWWLCKAWRLAKKMYNKALKDERAMLGAKGRARWADFRVYDGWNGAGPLNGALYNAVLSPSGWQDQNMGEWDHSRIDAQGATPGLGQGFTFGAAIPGQVWSIIEEFDRTYNTTAAPSSLSADLPYDELDEVMISETDYDEVQDNGNLPPYAQNSLPTAVWVKVATLDGDAGDSGRTSTGTFDIPFGFVAIRNNSGGVIPDGSVRFEAAKGKYKGVYMEAC